MICPKCKKADGLKIYCYSPSAVYVDREGNTVDESDEFSGFDWDDESIMECTECDYEGVVADFLKADPGDGYQEREKAAPVDVLREFCRDMETVGVKRTAKDWPDLLITYRKAKAALSNL